MSSMQIDRAVVDVPSFVVAVKSALTDLYVVPLTDVSHSLSQSHRCLSLQLIVARYHTYLLIR